MTTSTDIEVDVDDDDETDGPEAHEDEVAGARNRLAISLRSPQAAASCFGIVVLVVLAVLVGWLGVQAREFHQAAAQHQEFLAAGRQGAVNLTSIDWQHVDEDVQRILNNATGSFHDEFASRSKPFIDVVKRAQSASVGTVTEVGLESATDHDAQVLVAVSVKTTLAGAPQQDPRAWRMRIRRCACRASPTRPTRRRLRRRKPRAHISRPVLLRTPPSSS